MKKKILLLVLVVCLVFGGIGGVIYAQVEHEPIVGDKLIGAGLMGTIPNDDRNLGDYQVTPYFTVTNPNCDSSITDIHVSVLITSTEGIVESLYEGPLKVWYAPDGELSSLTAHQTVLIQLQPYLGEGVLEGPPQIFTIEISYSADNGAASLIGWQSEWTSINKFGTLRDQARQSPMINVTTDKKAKH